MKYNLRLWASDAHIENVNNIKMNNFVTVLVQVTVLFFGIYAIPTSKTLAGSLAGVLVSIVMALWLIGKHTQKHNIKRR